VNQGRLLREYGSGEGAGSVQEVIRFERPILSLSLEAVDLRQEGVCG